MKLFLDDERVPTDVTWIDIGPGPWIIIRDVETLIHIVRYNYKDITAISLDNDLGMDSSGKKLTIGRKFLDWFEDFVFNEKYQNNIYLPTITVHSKNSVETKVMIQVIDKIKRFLSN
jgi:methionine synthase II (cobalamin-independent)